MCDCWLAGAGATLGQAFGVQVVADSIPLVARALRMLLLVALKGSQIGCAHFACKPSCGDDFGELELLSVSRTTVLANTN